MKWDPIYPKRESFPKSGERKNLRYAGSTPARREKPQGGVIFVPVYYQVGGLLSEA